MLPRLLSSACLLALALSSSGARAQAAAAETLFDKGREQMSAGDYPSACQSFQESDRLDPAVGTRFNLADCEEKRGRLATAWELFKAVERDLRPGDERLPIARERREALEPKVPRLKVTLAQGTPKEATVSCGALTLGAASLGLALPVDPGKRECTVKAPGAADRTYAVEVKPGDTLSLEVRAGEAGGRAAAPVVVARPAVVPAAAKPAGSSPVLGYVLAGVGVVGLGAFAVTGLMTLHDKSVANDECNDARQICSPAGKDANDTGRILGPISTASLAVGAVGLGLGTYFILSSHGSARSETAIVTNVSPQRVGLGLARRF
jgi:hypothetical protein